MAYSHNDVLDAPLNEILGATQIDVVSDDPGGDWSQISVFSLGTAAIAWAGAGPTPDGSGRQLIVPTQSMGAVGKQGTPQHVVLHNGSNKILYQTTGAGTAITQDAEVTVMTFNIKMPQPA